MRGFIFFSQDQGKKCSHLSASHAQAIFGCFHFMKMAEGENLFAAHVVCQQKPSQNTSFAWEKRILSIRLAAIKTLTSLRILLMCYGWEFPPSFTLQLYVYYLKCEGIQKTWRSELYDQAMKESLKFWSLLARKKNFVTKSWRREKLERLINGYVMPETNAVTRDDIWLKSETWHFEWAFAVALTSAVHASWKLEGSVLPLTKLITSEWFG